MARGYSHNRTIYNQKRRRRLLSWIQHNYRLSLWGAVGVVAIILSTLQVVVLADRMPLFFVMDGQPVGGQSVAHVSSYLDNKYRQAAIILQAKGSQQQLASIQADALGVTASNRQRAEQAVTPLWLRMVPTSALWARWLTPTTRPQYQVDTAQLSRYVTDTFGEDCKIQPQNASLRVDGHTLVVVPSKQGAECQTSELTKALGAARPSIQQPVRVTLPASPLQPSVSDTQAEELKRTIEQRAQGTLVVRAPAGERQVTIPAHTVLGWLRFATPKDSIEVTLDSAASEEFLRTQVAPLIGAGAGGRSRQAQLDYSATRQAVVDYVTGRSDTIRAAVQSSRSTQPSTTAGSDEKLSALLKQYTEGKKGSFGIALTELSGKRRHAEYNGTKQFTSASTYKLLLAFSVLKRIEAGQMAWGDQTEGGRDLAKCFDDMIVLSDNPCPTAIAKRVGISNIQKDMVSLGLNDTNFRDMQSYKMTAGDLAKFAAMLANYRLPLKRESQDKLLGAMRRNVHRRGIPAGSNGTVADKVGFIEDYLHDVGIVYGTGGGTYVLAILTQGSSWADIADLTKRIEQLHTQQ